MRPTMIVFCLLAATAAAQTPAGVQESIIKGKRPPVAAASNVQLAKAADGTWKCVSAGKPCTDPQLQVLRNATKTRSNIQNNFTFNGDGSVSCTNAGKPCSDAEVQNTFSEVSKAVAKGGQQGN